MKLFYAPPSPYSRKVRVLARELGLQGSIEEIAVHTTPVAPAHEVTQANPLSKIPTLVTDGGESLFDSRVICEYLVSLAPQPWCQLQGEAHWASLRRQALADGILDAALIHRYETVLRPPDLHWSKWLDAQLDKVHRGVAELNEDLPTELGYMGLDAIGVACTLAWLDFRMPDLDWRGGHENLVRFMEAFSTHRAMLETPPDAAT